MYQGDPNVFIQKEIEVGLKDGVDIRPHLKPGMTGKEVRDLRLSLWAKGVYAEGSILNIAKGISPEN